MSVLGAGQRQAVAGLALSREFLLLAALAILSLGDTIRLGTYSAPALELVVLAALLIAGATLSRNETSIGTIPWTVLAGGTAAVVLIYANPLGLPPIAWTAPVLVGAVVVLLIAPNRSLRWIAAAIGAGAFTGSIVIALRTQATAIDVYQALQGASSALIHGHNPYQPTFSAESPVTPFTFRNIPVHFEYLPGAAIITAPGRLLGDVRLMSIVAFAALMAFALRLAWLSPERGTRIYRVGALCLALPMTVAMVYFSWVDVFSMAGFAGWIALRGRHRRWSIAFLVLTLTVKPVILIAIVPMLLWSRRARREFAVAVLVALALTLPFAVATGFGNLYQDVIGLQADLGFRGDGLTLNAAWYAITSHLLPVWFGILAGAAVGLFALWRRPADLAAVLGAGALLSTAAFLLAKWAFLNYYFIPVWLLVLALASRGVPLEGSPADVALPGLQDFRLRDGTAPPRRAATGATSV
jgi:hypothetical protein